MWRIRESISNVLQSRDVNSCLGKRKVACYEAKDTRKKPRSTVEGNIMHRTETECGLKKAGKVVGLDKTA
jgi:hypothetical protein